MLRRCQPDHAWTDLIPRIEPPSNSGRFIISVFEPKHGVRPLVRKFVFDRGSHSFHKLLIPGPTAIAIPIELWPQGYCPGTGDMPPADDIRSHDERARVA